LKAQVVIPDSKANLTRKQNENSWVMLEGTEFPTKQRDKAFMFQSTRIGRDHSRRHAVVEHEVVW
jgi:hypothetical protein